MTNTMVKHLIFQIFIVFLLIQLAYAAEPKYYSLYLNNEKGEISIVEKKLIIYDVYIPEKRAGEFAATITDFSGNSLYSEEFSFPTHMRIFDANEEVIEQELESSSIVLFLPYYKNGKSISVYDENGKEKLSIDVSKYSTEGRGLFDLLLENWLLILFAAGILFVAGVIALALLKGRKEGNDGE